MTVNRATVQINGNEIDYCSFGTGARPLVMLPGLSVKSVLRSAEGVASAYRVFAEDFTVYLFDRTKFLTKNYTVEQLSEDAAAAMRALSLENACVFGASQGGMMALYIAAAHPELVARLALGSAAARLNPTARRVMDSWVEAAEKGDPDGFSDSFISLLYGGDFWEKYGEFIKLNHRDVTAEDFRRFIILGRSCDTLDVYDRLGDIRCPSLVLGAVNDRVLTAQASFEIAVRLGCPCYLYGGEYGHCVFDEAPDFKRRLYDFFMQGA